MSEVELRKAEKKDFLELKQRTPLDLTCKIATKDEVQRLFADFIGEQNKKSFNLRRELFEKVTELQKDIAQSVT